jgi:hypothetical protein
MGLDMIKIEGLFEYIKFSDIVEENINTFKRTKKDKR